MSRRNARSGKGQSNIVDLTLETDEEPLNGTESVDEFGHEVLNVIAGNPITSYHINILKGGDWLNDEIINAYLHTLQTDSVHAISTFFYPKLCKEGLSDATKRWLKPIVRITAFRLILVPVNMNNNTHWALAAYEVASRQLAFYDSMLHRRSAMSTLERIKPVFEYLHDQLNEEEDEVEGEETTKDCDDILSSMLTKLRLKDKEEKTKIILRIPENQPRQTDGSSCGVFVCKRSQVLASESKAAFNQNHVTQHRTHILETLKAFK